MLMKTRALILAIFFLALITGGLFLAIDSHSDEIKAPVSPKSQSITDAINYTNFIKGDLITGKIDRQLVRQAISQLDNMPHQRALNLNWEFAGPDNIGGRSRAILIDKDNPEVMLAGGVSGGIFKSIDGGQHWTRKEYDAELGGLSISCFAQASDGTIYVGTGELFFTAMSGPNGNLTSGAIGGGVYKSNDLGESWTFLSSTDPASSGNTRWENVQSIVIDPNNASVVYAGTYNGLMKSTDAGQNWTRQSLPGAYVSSVIIDLKVSPDGATLFAAAYKSFKCQIFRSKNNGDFVRIGANDVSDNQSRITLAIAPSNPNYIYAAGASNGGGGYQAYSTEGIYQSKDNGDTWTKIVKGNSEAEVFGRFGHYQGQYDNCIAVDPNNENRIFVGGVDLYCWNDGFWYKAASTSEFTDADNQFFNPFYIHADKHIIVFETRTNPQRMFIGTDGGIHVSTNFDKKYPTYRSLNVNFTTTQFYGIAASLEGDLVGGTQDNGSMMMETDGLTGNSALDIWGGDGFYCEISKYDNNIYFVESQYGNIGRTKNKGKDMSSFADDLNIAETSYNFNTPFRLWEDRFDTTMYDTTGKPFDTTVTLGRFFVAFYDGDPDRTGLWMSEDPLNFTADTIKWYKLSDGMSGFRPQCIEYTPDGNTVFVGGTTGGTGRIYRISGIRNVTYKWDASGNFDPVAHGIQTDLIGSFSGRSVTGIGISPTSKNTVVAALGNYSSNADHIYICKNALTASPTFTSIQGNLPVMPVYDAVINTKNTNQNNIIIATEFGIFSTTNGGSTWSEENNGVNRGPVYMLRQITRPWWTGYVIFAGTHGQGIYKTTSLVTNLGIKQPEKKADYVSFAVYPNPASSFTNLSIHISSKEDLQARIYDLNGKVISTMNLAGKLHTGTNNLRISTSNLETGIYIIRLTGEGISRTSRLVVLK